ncbi:serine hydrolase domain-containing protein [Pararhodonellum marinum]|uniref:serine hydrolase domain-containing protein n=1 Tax=Pararhodonellum marinum TaxID=2755358 RepID=UPI00188DF521|nr:serine hydrolase domain-containing protein [Pararhodonellum marinum]
MKTIIVIILGFLFGKPAYSQEKKELVFKIDSIVTPLVNTNNFSGSILVTQNGNELFSKAYGKMSQEFELDNNLNTKYFIASVSMIFTSAAVMKLNESGLIKLDDKVSKFLPHYQHGNKLTIGDLLSQRSGIPAIGTNGNVNYDSITKFEHNSEELYAYFKDYELLFEPGSKYNHGRSDYIILAYIIELITGKSFGEYLQDEIFTPLGMANTGHFSTEKEIIKNLAKGYAPKNLYDLETAFQIDWSSKTGHGSIYSTVYDLRKFAQAALDNDFLTKDSWNKIFQNHGDNVGYGWFIRKHLHRDLFQMNGRSPGFSSYLGIYPEENLIVIVLSNNYISLPASLGGSIAAMTMNEPFEGLNLTDKTLTHNFAEKLIGSYKFDGDFYSPNIELEITFEEGYLISDWGGLVPIDKGNENFLEYILRTYWSSIEFVEGENGEITQMKYDDHIGLKVK